MKPQIFISHGERDDNVTQFRRLLVERLKLAGHEPKVDDSNLERDVPEGGGWADALDEWIFFSHGAVIILDKRAVDRPWCQYETASILARHRLEKIPVVVVACDVEHDKLPPLLADAARLPRELWITLKDEAIGTVLERVDPLKALLDDSIEGMHIRQVAEMFTSVSYQGLYDAVNCLNRADDFKRIRTDVGRRLSLARWLMEEPDLETVASSLASLRTLSPDHKADILKSAAILKVDEASVRDIPDIVHGAGRSERVFALRAGTQTDVVEWQLKRPFCPKRVTIERAPRNNGGAATADFENAVTALVYRKRARLYWPRPPSARIVVADPTGVPESAVIALGQTMPDVPLCLIGDEAGQSDAWHLTGLDWPPDAQEEQQARFENALELVDEAAGRSMETEQ